MYRRKLLLCHSLLVIFTAQSTYVHTALLCYGMSSVCLTVRPSVTLVDCDHLNFDSWKVISPINGPILPLLGDPNTLQEFEG